MSLLRARHAATVASSSTAARALHELQDRFGDGPCRTAIREHTVIRVGDVRNDPRWPDVLEAAAEQGIQSILALPFTLGEEARAAMTLYSSAAHDFSAPMIQGAIHRVRRASQILRLAVRLAQHREQEKHLRAAMATRTTIDLAAGILMGQHPRSQDDAIALLTRASQHRNIALREVAAELVEKVSSLPPRTHFE